MQSIDEIFCYLFHPEFLIQSQYHYSRDISKISRDLSVDRVKILGRIAKDIQEQVIQIFGILNTFFFKSAYLCVLFFPKSRPETSFYYESSCLKIS